MPKRKKQEKKKKVYDVYGTVVGGKFLGHVEADSPDEAEQLVWDGKKLALDVSFCHQCSSECENAEITELHIEESDGH